MNFNRKKKISGGLPATSNREHSMMKKNSGFGSDSLSNGKNATSEGSSVASRFYDNEAENSSISDTFNANNNSHSLNNNHNNNNNDLGSVFNNNDNVNINGFKMAFGQQPPPQINNRSSGKL